jgi:hypothetical protein
MEEHRLETMTDGGSSEEQPVPAWQVFFDDIFLLLALGLAVPLILYIIWGIWDLTHVPPFTP